MIVARYLGEPGFAAFARTVHRLGIVSHSELLGLLELHGAVVRACKSPLDDGTEIDEVALYELKRLLDAEER